MDRVHALHAKTMQMENVLTGLRDLKSNIANDVVVPDDVETDVHEMLLMLDKSPTNMRKFSSEELIDQLKQACQLE